MADQNKHDEQRSFERFPLDFLVEVSGIPGSGKTFVDKGYMRDVSGSGLCFSTAHIDAYTVGQELQIRVCLPGTDELAASMVSSAKVAWIHVLESQESSPETKALIGIAMDGCMAFESNRSGQPDIPLA